jgi:hypothetical protein
MDKIQKVNIILLILWTIYSATFTAIMLAGIISISNKKGPWSNIELIISILLALIVLIIFIKVISLLNKQYKSIYNINSFNQDIFNKYNIYIGILIMSSLFFTDTTSSSFIPEIASSILLVSLISILIISVYKINYDLKFLKTNSLYNQSIKNPTSYSQASTQSSPQISFTEKDNLTPTNITQPSTNTPLQEIQSEYNSNQNSTESLTQKIQNHYTDNAVNATQEYVVKSNPNKLRNLIFSGFLILGFLAFSFLSLGGIIVGDLTVSGVLAVASIILVIDGYLFYLMWFKR